MTSVSTRQRAYRGALLFSVLVGLAATGYGVFDPHTLEVYSDSPDSVDIAQCAEKATWPDILRWWSGTWVQSGSPYYRPLSSMAFWLQYKAFGWDFQGYVIVSWLLHGLICAFLFRFAYGLLPGTPLERAVFAALAVVLFNVRRGPSGPGWIPAPVAYGVVAWWPGQTDQLCLACCLPALILLDRWLSERHRRHLVWAIALWGVALLFKEMAITMPVPAGLLVLLRRGPEALRLWERSQGVRRLSLGLLWRLTVPGLLLSGGFLLARRAMVPEAWGPRAREAGYFLTKVLWYAAELPQAIITARGAWVVVVSLFLALCLYVYARLPRRPAVVWPALVMLLGAGALAQALAGNFAIITVPREMAAIGTMTLFLLGIIVLLHVRSGPTWALLAMLAAIHVPILHVQGPHYLYWPAAFWGLVNASLVKYVWDSHTSGRLRFGRAAPEPCTRTTEGTGG